MKLFTSSFRKYGKHENAVSIALYEPIWFMGRQYKKLAPTKEILSKQLASRNNSRYTKMYYNDILLKLNPIDVYNELGENSILLCYERSGVFCHRHIVAEWLMSNLDIDVIEI